jgi:hypothetical protein
MKGHRRFGETCYVSSGGYVHPLSGTMSCTHRVHQIELSETLRSHVSCFVVLIATLSQYLSVVSVEDWGRGGRDEIDVLASVFLEGLTKATKNNSK